MPFLFVSRMLGHADVSTTAKHYAGLADSTLAAEIDKVNIFERSNHVGILTSTTNKSQVIPSSLAVDNL